MYQLHFIWICLRWFFTASTMVNHHVSPPFGRIFWELFASIEHANPSLKEVDETLSFL